MLQDDIAALATPPGESGIAIIRMSGPEVIQKTKGIFQPVRKEIDLRDRKGYSITLGYILDKKGEKIDEVLINLMREPKSYTGEDVIEINCHGGMVAARRCFKRVLENNIRMAEPGEFTKRAYLNGRLDASQAEAVIDIIRAKTEKALRLAINQLDGRLGHEIHCIEDELISIYASIEASIDFPDEVGEADYNELKTRLVDQLKVIKRMMKSSRRCEIYRDGVNVAIIGKPNVGKSSLLNALVKKEKAIVTSLPGTTRDVIEEYINIRGIPVRIMDTAGIRETLDPIESIGVERSRLAIRGADLVIFVLDVGSGIAQEDIEIFKSISEQKVIVLINKDDLTERRIDREEVEKQFSCQTCRTVVWVSVKEGQGLEKLEDAIENMVFSGELESDQMELALNIRQKNALEKAIKGLKEALANLEKVPLDCLVVELWGALESLGEISGKSLKEDVVNRIFRDFCIGK